MVANRACGAGRLALRPFGVILMVAMRAEPWVVAAVAVCAVGGACARSGRGARSSAAGGPASPLAARLVAGVGVIVSAADWEGNPPADARGVTALQITLRNESGRPVLVRYRDFSLVTASGARHAALPPAPPEPPRQGTQVFEPVYSSYGFSVAPDLRLYFPTYPATEDPFPADRAYQRATFATWPPGLPSQQLRDRALPEGVLENHGNVRGYLYFAAFPGREPRLSFEVHMLAAPRGEELATTAVDLDLR
jgi:hypothetical protein